MKIFGFEIKRNTEEPISFAPKTTDDGAVVVNEGGVYGTYVDLDGSIRTEAELVNKYREMASHPEVDMAVDDIVNEVVTQESEEQVVELILDEIELPDRIKKLFITEFKDILSLLEFTNLGYEIFRRWYVDGRLYYHVIIDEKNPKSGIVELRYIDPRKIRKVRQVRKKALADNTALNQTSGEFYIYNDKGFAKTSGNSSIPSNSIGGIKIAKDSIVQCTSGLTSPNGDLVQSYLHKAIKPLNQLRSMEDSLVIYRISRAPERRIFYVDVGNLPKAKAEQYLRDIMIKFKNKLVYDAATGETRDDRKFMTMLEDFWLPRREGRGTEITTLPGGCLAMDTKVSLLDGRDLSIREIENEMKLGKTLWTYSCDPKTGKIVPGLISWAGVTQTSAQVMKLILDNNEEIICTPDHKFPVYGKGFVEAKDLEVNESMIPLYKKKNFISETKKLDYEQYFDNELKEWFFTHRLVSDFLRDSVVKYYIYNEEYSNESYDVRHHIDFDRHNNDPSNLCWMSWHDHQKLHADFGFSHEASLLGAKAAKDKLKWLKENDPELYRQRSETISKRMLNWYSSLTEEEFENLKNKRKENLLTYWENISPEERERKAKISASNGLKGPEGLRQKLKNDPEFAKQYSDNIKAYWADPIHGDERRKNRSEQSTKSNIERWNDPEWSKWKREFHKETQTVSFNHEILKTVIDLVNGKTSHQITCVDIVNILNEDKDLRNIFIDDNKNKTIPNFDSSNGFSENLMKKMVVQWGYKSWKDFRVKESVHNHRIIAIEYLESPIEVGTLTIDQDEIYHDHHTFALSCGIFTKNSNLGQMDDVIYFQKKLYKSLNVPVSRLDPEQQFNFGRATEITRDEVKFSKFTNRLRNKFATLFTKVLERQLILKGIITAEEWDQIKDSIRYKFAQDNYYAELKETEILRDRITMLRDIDDYAGKYYSHEWIRRNVLRQSDEEMEEIDEQIEEEQDNPQYNPPMPEQSGEQTQQSEEDQPQQDEEEEIPTIQ